MAKEVPHLGTYIWTRSNDESNPRPMAGSIAHLKAEAEMEAERKANSK